MVSGVVLTSALRENLLSLQNTQRLIDDVQLRLATGLEVNSALDNPANFFSAQRLGDRASDLQRLLDDISQSVRVIEEASNGVTALTGFIEQIEAIAQSAADELAANANEARALGNVDLSEVSDLTSLNGIADGDQFQILTTNDSGTQISETITISTGDTAASFAANITDQFADNQNGEIIAQVTDAGFISLASSDGRTFRIIDGLVGSGNEVSDAGFDSLGLGSFFEIEFTAPGGVVSTRSAATIVAGNTISSVSLFESTGDLTEAGDTLVGSTFQDADGNTLISGLPAGGIIFFRTYSDDGVPFPLLNITANTTFQDIVNAVNFNTDLNELVSADFDSNTGQLSFTSLSDSLDAFEIGVFGVGAVNFDIGLGDPSGNIDPIVPGGGFFSLESRVFSFNTSSVALDNLAVDYETVRQQINDLVQDANFRGINLLSDEDLTVFFNENLSSSLVTEGVNFSADGLGLTTTSFRSLSEIEQTSAQAREALEQVRSFGSTLANNLSVIQTRQTFTQELINTLSAGADDLTVADQNREGANLLALQTRQALGVTSLSLASLSQQSVLRIF